MCGMDASTTKIQSMETNGWGRETDLLRMDRHGCETELGVDMSAEILGAPRSNTSTYLHSITDLAEIRLII